MRSHPGSFDLSFLLPRGAQAVAVRGLCAGCSIEIEGPLVRVIGDSREAVFDCASDVVRGLHRFQPISISSILHSPARPSGFDRWSIIVGADVAFSPTSLDPHFPRQARP